MTFDSLRTFVAATALLAGCGLAPNAAASGEARGTTRAVSADLQALDRFVGRWQCDGRRFGPRPGEAQRFSARYEFRPILSARWIGTHYQEIPSAENPQPLSIAEVWGYDAVRQTLVNRWVNSLGGAGEFRAAGWQADTLVWAADDFPTPAGKARVRAVFRLHDPQRFDVAPEMAGADGAWTRFAEFSCRADGVKPLARD